MSPDRYLNKLLERAEKRRQLIERYANVEQDTYPRPVQHEPVNNPPKVAASDSHADFLNERAEKRQKPNEQPKQTSYKPQSPRVNNCVEAEKSFTSPQPSSRADYEEPTLTPVCNSSLNAEEPIEKIRLSSVQLLQSPNNFNPRPQPFRKEDPSEPSVSDPLLNSLIEKRQKLTEKTVQFSRNISPRPYKKNDHLNPLTSISSPYSSPKNERTEKRQEQMEKVTQSPRTNSPNPNKRDDCSDPSMLSVSARRALFERNMKIKSATEDSRIKVYPLELPPKKTAQRTTVEAVPVYETPEEVNIVRAVPAIVSPVIITPEKVSSIEPSSSEVTPETDYKFNYASVEDCPMEVMSEKFAPVVVNTVEKTSEEDSPAVNSVARARNHGFSISENVSFISRVEKTPEKIIPEDESSNRIYPRLPSLCDLSPLKISPVKDLSRLSSPVKATTPMRTLSQYRREQKKQFSSQVQSHEEVMKSKWEDEVHKRDLFKEQLRAREAKIDLLKAEADKYNKMIYQSYQALDLCIRTNNVPERLEVEKILLVNSERKKACCSELLRIQRSNDIALNEDPVGRITIKRVKLLIRGDFIVKQTYGHDAREYFFICLFKCGEVVIETEVLSSSEIQNACLTFNKEVTFNEMRKDFIIHLDIYALKLNKTKKSHKKLDQMLTPKKKKDGICASSSSSASRTKESDLPGLSFHLVGSGYLVYDNLLNNLISFERFKYNHILEDQAIINASMCCRYNIKYASYLNFHQMSGDYPVWNRRWCVLNGPLMYYWRYEEDEEAKEPMGFIQLKKCVNKTIERATSEICMRSNSFAFVTIDEHKTPMKHLMAADLPAERDDWLSNLNKVLSLARTWEENAVKPFDEATLDSLLRST